MISIISTHLYYSDTNLLNHVINLFLFEKERLNGLAILKLKLTKSYLRSTMSQERLSELAILSIEKEMLEEVKYKNLISNFASQKAIKIDFK